MNKLIALLLLAPSLAFGQSNYQQTILADGPSAYWPLDDAAGGGSIRELVGNLWTFPVWNAQVGLGVSGLPSGGSAWHYSGPFAWSFEFASYWQVDHNPAIDLGSTLSIEAWFKSDIPTSEWGQVLVQKLAAYSAGYWPHPWAGGGFSMGTRYWHGGIEASVCGDGTYDCLTITSAANVPANDWRHVVLTFGGGVLRLYINGRLDASVATSRTDLPWPNGGPLFIGSSTVQKYWCDLDPQGPYCQHSIFHGTLQNLALYQHALTEAQVASHYDAGMSSVVSVVSPSAVAERPEADKIYDVQGRRVDPAMGRSGVTFKPSRKRVTVK